MLKRYPYILLLLLPMLLTSCGFHWQHGQLLPPQLHRLYLQTNDPYNNFISKLCQRLQQHAILLVDNPKQAPLTLKIIAIKQYTRAISSSFSVQTRVYSLNYEVIFSLNQANGHVIIGPLQATATTTFTLAANDLLDNSPQPKEMIIPLQTAVIERLFDYLSAQNTKKALYKLYNNHHYKK